MTLRLARLDALVPIANPDGTPTQQFIRFWQRAAEAIEQHEAEQEATIARIRRMTSHTEPTTILTATEDGATSTITVAAHTRVYGDATTLAVLGGSQAGLACNTLHAVYYDDATLEDTTPTYVFTTVLPDAMAAKAEGRHFCGVILTPVAASGDTIESGGAYPVANSLFGELD